MRMVELRPAATDNSMLGLAVRKLVSRGHRVEAAIDALGMFRVNGGPLIQAGQVIGLSARSDALLTKSFVATTR